MTQAGFSGTEAVIYDEELPYHTSATIIASPIIKQKPSKKVSILSTAPTGSVATKIAAILAERGFIYDFCSVQDTPKPGQDIISVLDLEGKAFLADISAEQFHRLQNFIANLKSSGMLWLTKSCQIESSEPQYAQIIGLARSVRNELSVDLATLEIDSLEDETTLYRVLDVFGKFQCRSKDSAINPEFEYAIFKGVINISRFHWISISNELSLGTDPEAPKALEIGKRGSLNTLRWVQKPHVIELTGDEISVEVRAVGMNFKVIRLFLYTSRVRHFIGLCTDWTGYSHFHGYC